MNKLAIKEYNQPELDADRLIADRKRAPITGMQPVYDNQEGELICVGFTIPREPKTKSGRFVLYDEQGAKILEEGVEVITVDELMSAITTDIERRSAWA